MVGLLPSDLCPAPAPHLPWGTEMMAAIHSKPQGKFYVWAGLESSQSPSSDVPSHMQRAGGYKRVRGGITLPLLSDPWDFLALVALESGGLPSCSYGQRSLTLTCTDHLTPCPSQALVSSAPTSDQGGSARQSRWISPADSASKLSV